MEVAKDEIRDDAKDKGKILGGPLSSQSLDLFLQWPEENTGEEAGDIYGLDEKRLLELGDEEADALLEELAESQSEVARMIAEQRQGASDLSGLRDSLTAELETLKQEAWKLEMFGELDSLKKQLEAIQGLDQDLDAAEAMLEGHTREGEPADQPVLDDINEEGEGEDGADLEEIAALQASLDLELSQMLAQLSSVREEAAAAASKKEELTKQLAALMAGDYGEEEEEVPIEGLAIA